MFFLFKSLYCSSLFTPGKIYSPYQCNKVIWNKKHCYLDFVMLLIYLNGVLASTTHNQRVLSFASLLKNFDRLFIKTFFIYCCTIQLGITLQVFNFLLITLFFMTYVTLLGHIFENDPNTKIYFPFSISDLPAFTPCVSTVYCCPCCVSVIFCTWACMLVQITALWVWIHSK